eukprot:11248020-Heterocapsa_arctica.AAC.1
MPAAALSREGGEVGQITRDARWFVVNSTVFTHVHERSVVQKVLEELQQRRPLPKPRRRGVFQSPEDAG